MLCNPGKKIKDNKTPSWLLLYSFEVKSVDGSNVVK